MADEQQRSTPTITHVRLFQVNPNTGEYRAGDLTREEWLDQEEQSGYLFDNEVWVGENKVRVTTIPQDAWLAKQRPFIARS